MDNREPKSPDRKKTPKPYLLHNQVRKSTTEFVLSIQYRLARVHKLEMKLALSQVTRPNIAYLVSVLSQYMSSPTINH